MTCGSGWLLLALLLPVLAAAACDEGEDGFEQEGCTYESCRALCQASHAEELESCGGICAVESFCLTSGQCRCSFHHCHEETCRQWCADNEGLENGGCGAISGNFLSCDCW